MNNYLRIVLGFVTLLGVNTAEASNSALIDLESLSEQTRSNPYNEQSWNKFNEALDLAVQEKNFQTVELLKKFLVENKLDLHNYSSGKFRNWTEVEETATKGRIESSLPLWAPWLKIENGKLAQREQKDPVTFW